MPAMPQRIAPRGFTLVELLVVIAIIGLISAVALPVVLPALNERKVSESARILQAVLVGTRDAAIRANAPRGIRLLPDPVFTFAADTGFASNRFVAIEPAPDYSEGAVQNPSLIIPNGGTPIANPIYDPTYDISTGVPVAIVQYHYLRIAESGAVPPGLYELNSPTSWKYNIRQGDKIRFNDSGNYYTVAGPINGTVGNGANVSMVNNKLTVQNPERYISYIPAETSTGATYLATGWIPEYLNLTNGVDDDGDGWVDESCDGIDNDGDGVIDPGYNGIDDNNNGVIDEYLELGIGRDPSTGNASATAFTEWEQEVFLGVQSSTNLKNEQYTIVRRAVPSPGSAETTLPAGVVIDLTTWNAAASHNGTTLTPTVPERSRLPVDPYSGYVDIMIDQSGRVVPPGAGSGAGFYNHNSPLASLPFYHFWLTEREGVVAPLWDTAATATTYPYAPAPNPNYGTQNFLLPMPQGTPNYTQGPPYLQGERRLVTLFTKTGQIVSNSIESFNAADTSTPFYDAQSGTKESQ